MKLTPECTAKVDADSQNIIGHMCYAASKLWNEANYERMNRKSPGPAGYPDWYVQKKKLKGDMWYKDLPSRTARETLKRLDDKGWKSFYALQKSGGIQNPRPPRYKQGPIPIVCMQNGIQHDRANAQVRLSLPEKLKEFMKATYDIDQNYLWIQNELLGQVNVIKQIVVYPPENGECRMLIIHEVPDVPVLPDNGRWLSIDPELHNLMACFDNAGAAFIVGRRYLSICRNYDGKISQAQSQWGKTQTAHGVQYPKTSGHVLKLYHRKNQCVKDCLHKVMTAIADYCVKNEITRVILGDITGIRKGRDFGAKTNQKLHGLPFAKICAMLRYRLGMRGILLVMQEESCTSQCPPLSPEVSKKEQPHLSGTLQGRKSDPERRFGRGVQHHAKVAEKTHPEKTPDPGLLKTPSVMHIAV